MQGNIQKIFIVTEITASELVSLNCLYSSSEMRLFRHLSDYVFGVTSSPKIWHVNKREFFEHNFRASHQ